MDYNLWYQLNGAQDDPTRVGRVHARHAGHLPRRCTQTVFNGNRAPLVIANHFNDWAGGAFSGATEQFMGEMCDKPETVCATYYEVIAWLKLQDPAVIDSLRGLPAAHN